jgi:RNA polymerase sigma-70 factor, ECF subfamily
MALSNETIIRTLLDARARIAASVWLIAREAHVTEDIFQEVCVRALSKAGPFEHEGQLLSWAHVTARHEAIDVMRRRKPEWVGLDSDLLDLIDAEWSADEVASGGRLDALRTCLEAMPAGPRRLLELRYFEGLPCSDVAQTLGVRLDAVYQRLSRLHQALGACIEKRLTGDTTLPLNSAYHAT